MPPLYEYRCEVCGEVRTELRSISEYDKPLIAVCIDRPKSAIEELMNLEQRTCEFKRILSPTPTTFRFNDTGGGFKGLTKRVNRK